MYGFLNLGSLLFGLIAWILPVINLVKKNKSENKNWIILSLSSVSACSISLCMQILYINHLVEVGHLSALMDTSDFIAFVSLVLLGVTIFLTIMTLFIYSKSSRK